MDVLALYGKCPKKVWIGTTEYALLFVDADHEKLQEPEEELNGCCIHEPPEIYICRALPLTRGLEIVVHELTHAIDDEYEVEDGFEEEELCKRHGKAWSTFWINNPRFARWWLSACVAVRKARQSGSETKGTK